MKIKIIRGTVINKSFAKVGDIVDVEATDAKFLIAIGKAVAVEEKAEEKDVKVEKKKEGGK